MCLDVTPAFGFGSGLGTPAALLADHFVQGRVQLARLKGLARLHHLAALPPLGVDFSEDLLLPLAYNGQLVIAGVVL